MTGVEWDRREIHHDELYEDSAGLRGSFRFSVSEYSSATKIPHICAIGGRFWLRIASLSIPTGNGYILLSFCSDLLLVISSSRPRVAKCSFRALYAPNPS